MNDNTDGTTGAPTRRDYMKYGGTVVGGGLLAGCSGPRRPERTGFVRRVGRLVFGDDGPDGRGFVDSPPESIFTRLTHHAGMAFALGRGNDANAMHASDYYDGLWNQFIERLPGVTLDWSGLYSSWDPDEEMLYDLDSDIHPRRPGERERPR